MLYDKSVANTVLNGGKLRALPLQSRVRQGGPLLSFIQYSTEIKVLARTVKTRETNKGHINMKTRRQIIPILQMKSSNT